MIVTGLHAAPAEIKTASWAADLCAPSPFGDPYATARTLSDVIEEHVSPKRSLVLIVASPPIMRVLVTLQTDRLHAVSTIYIGTFPWLPLIRFEGFVFLDSGELDLALTGQIWASDEVRPSINLPPQSESLQLTILLIS